MKYLQPVERTISKGRGFTEKNGPPHQVWGTSVALHLKRMEYFNWEKRRHGAEKAGGACLAFFSLPSPPRAGRGMGSSASL